MQSNNETELAPPPEESSVRIRAHVLREISVAAGADPRSVRKVLAGERLRTGATHERILAALRARGISLPLAIATSPTLGDVPR